jgi:AcrR family transcriptional regulator
VGRGAAQAVGRGAAQAVGRGADQAVGLGADQTSGLGAAQAVGFGANRAGSSVRVGIVTSRPARRDARRNRARVLEAAREVFARDGVDASLNDVARRAEVGPATLYRHFPTREALLEALLADRYDALAALARDLSSDPSPRDAVAAWLRAFIAHLTTFRGLATPVRTALDDERSALFSACKGMRTAFESLLAHARRAGAVRADAQATDLLRLSNAIGWATEGLPGGAAEADRLLGLALRGFDAR